MFGFIVIVIAFVVGYALGARNGLPSLFNKKQLEERYDFLSLLKVGDEITIRARHVHSMTDKVKVLRNDPELKAIKLKGYLSDDFTLDYGHERLSEVINDNILLVADKFKNR